MTRTVNVEVYCDTTGGERDLFGVATYPDRDVPEFYDQMQKWVQENFGHLEVGDNIIEAGEIEYEPYGETIKLRKK